MTATKYNQTIKWPNDNFVLRCTDETFTPSKSSGNPMITLKFETVGLLKNDGTTTDEVDIGGDMFMIAGARLIKYYTTIVLDGEGVDEKKTKDAQSKVKELYEQFKLDADNINFENPILAFKGKLVMAYLQDEAKPKTRSPTKEQLDAGITKGEVILNPVTREPLIDHWPSINRIYGLAAAEAGKPY